MRAQKHSHNNCRTIATNIGRKLQREREVATYALYSHDSASTTNVWPANCCKCVWSTASQSWRKNPSTPIECATAGFWRDTYRTPLQFDTIDTVPHFNVIRYTHKDNRYRYYPANNHHLRKYPRLRQINPCRSKMKFRRARTVAFRPRFCRTSLLRLKVCLSVLRILFRLDPVRIDLP